MLKKVNKKLKLALYLILLVILAIFFYFLQKVDIPKKFDYGITFNEQTAKDFGLDWKQTYLAILDDLKVDRIRLAAYWDEIETSEDNYNFNDLDWMMSEAQKRNVTVILAVGSRLPRWPECHYPAWTKNLSDYGIQRATLKMIRIAIDHYKNYDHIKYWQVENEPFLTHFGDCPKVNADFLDQEIALVKSLDSRPVIVTDSGELSLWYFAYKRADIFGTTMYRWVYSIRFNSFIDYPIPPAYFRIKLNLMRLLAGFKPAIVVELQAEPWARKPLYELPKAEQDRTMNLDKFKSMINYAHQTGFGEYYLWGAEWWYWLKEKQNDPSFWNEAMKLWR